MNPMTNMKNVKKLSEQELHRTYKTSWHDQYRDSAWIFVGGLPYDLTEGDLICIFSQYGEIVNINLVRDKDSGKQKGFCFVCYEDQRSTVLAVDNFNGIKILGRTIRVDHVSDYKMPKDHKNSDNETRKLHNEGCAPSVKLDLPIPVSELPAFAKEEEAPPDGFRLPPRLPIGVIKIEEDTEASTSKVKVKKEKKQKKEKKHKKKRGKKKHKKKASSSESSNESSSSSSSDNSSEDSDSDLEEKNKNQSKIKEEKQNSIRSHKASHSDHDEAKIKTNRFSEERNQDTSINRRYKNEDFRRINYENYNRNYNNSRDDHSKFSRRENDKYDDRRYERDFDKNKRFSNDRKRPTDRDRDDSKRYRR